MSFVLRVLVLDYFWVFLGCFVFGIWLGYLCILSCVFKRRFALFLIYTTLLIKKNVSFVFFSFEILEDLWGFTVVAFFFFLSWFLGVCFFLGGWDACILIHLSF